MTSSALLAHGTQFKRSGTAVFEVTKIGGLELQSDQVDVTNTDSGGYYESIPGLKKYSDLSIEGNLRLDDSAGQMSMMTDQAAGTVRTYNITGPTTLAFDWQFTAYVKSFEIIAPVSESKPAGFKAVLFVTGTPVFTLTLSADLTALVLSDGTLTPSLTASEYDYVNITSTDTTTITATKAGATLNLYVDGVFSQTLTTATPSSAIATPSGSSKVFTISTKDSGKMPVWYRVVVANT